MSSLPGLRVRGRMTGRDIDEPHRASSTLELLFDLTFVVAVAQVASQLAHALAEPGPVVHGVGPYLMVFFAIWWAWIGFTWFASAYDTDDVPYRLLTLVQMAGVLVLAAGVPAAFQEQDFTAVTIGYVIMRVAMLVQWMRAGIENPDGRAVAYRYAIGIAVVQLGWVGRLFLPDSLGTVGFLVLVVAEVAVPVWAEWGRGLQWHPHHIAERYGLFTIILLGESVSAAAVAVQSSFVAEGASVELVVIGISALVLLFALWWLYFLEPAADGLVRRRGRVFLWGYGQYFLFAATAAIGAALEVAIEAMGHHVDPLLAGYALAVPVAVFLVTLFAVHAPLVERVATRPIGVVIAVLAVLLVPLGAPEAGVTTVVALIALVTAALTAATVLTRRR